MRLRPLLLLSALITALVSPGWADEPILTPERILNFKSEIHVKPDASLRVTETIVLTATGDQIKHGLVREFPVRYRAASGREVRVGFEIKDATCNGQPEPYRLEYANNSVLIYLGRKNVMLSPGVYTYTITYRTDHQLGFFPKYDELYWNVTGNQWPFVIEKAAVLIDLPLGATILQSAAYTGSFGSQGTNFVQTFDEQLRPIFSTTRPLTPGEGLTVSIAWPKGLVREPTPQEKSLQAIRAWLPDSALVTAGTMLLVLLYYLLIWIWMGRKPPQGTIIPRFMPPAQLSAGEVRYLCQKRYDPKVFSATVLSLAVKGFLKIEEAKKKFTLHKVGPTSTALSPDEHHVGQALLGGRPHLLVSNQNVALMDAAVSGLKKHLKTKFKQTHFITNRKPFGMGILLSAAGLITAMALAPNGNSSGLGLLWPFWLGIIFTFTALLFQQLKSLFRWFQWSKAFLFLVLTLIWGVCLTLAYLFFPLVAKSFSVLGTSLWVVIFLIHLLFFKLLETRTALGQACWEEIQGFKLFLSVTEKERLKLVDPPERTPALFDRYLPYAVALDVESRWSEQFTPVFLQAAQTGMAYMPLWYLGTPWHTQHWAQFSTHFNARFSDALSAAATAPGSTSGSGGGGYSGGGGGGGGGGGW